MTLGLKSTSMGSWWSWCWAHLTDRHSGGAEHPTGMVHMAMQQAGKGKEMHRKGLARLLPVSFCTFLEENSSGPKFDSEAFTLPERGQPKPCARGRALLCAGL